jgi:hypothetical protein
MYIGGRMVDGWLLLARFWIELIRGVTIPQHGGESGFIIPDHAKDQSVQRHISSVWKVINNTGQLVSAT